MLDLVVTLINVVRKILRKFSEIMLPTLSKAWEPYSSKTNLILHKILVSKHHTSLHTKILKKAL